MFKKFSKTLKGSLERHVAGATVLHSGPFSKLVVPETQNSLSEEIINTYVTPFYLANKGKEEYVQAYKTIEHSITTELVSILLAEYNWRPRSAAAGFVAVKELREFEDQIGKLLLRSDVCFSGKQYCLALAVFSTEISINILHEYLEYYLSKKDLHFDQGAAMAALNYIGRKRAVDLMSEHKDDWNAFTSDKDGWDLTRNIQLFDREMAQIVALR